MKAWVVTFSSELDYEEGWVDYVHADTREEAKSKFWKAWNWIDDAMFTDIRAYRKPELDNLPLTGDNLVSFGNADESRKENWELYDTCKCDLCNKAKGE